MIVSNFELNITSRVGTDDSGPEAPPGLVWQPTLTLWQPAQATAVLAGPTDLPATPDPHRELTKNAISPARRATIVDPTRLPARSESPAQNRWREIWRGDAPLAHTFWSYALLQSVTAATLTRLPWEEWASSGFNFVGLFAVLALLHFGANWGFLRAVWRATANSARQGAPALSCGLARGISLLLLIAGVHQAILVSAPRLVELSNIASGVIPKGSYQLKLVRGGTELAVDGAIGIGLSKKVSQVLELNPQVQTLQLNSHGGSTRESRQLRDLIARRKLSTTTSRGCSGECTLAYMAGGQRRIGDQASLRFYRSHQPGMPEWALWRDYEHDRRDWLARGVPGEFADQALTAPGINGWQPSLSELLAANIVSPAPEVLQFQAGDGEQLSLAVLDRELCRAPLFALLKEQEPEGYRTLVAAIHAGLRSSSHAENLRLRLHPMAKAVAYERLAHAEDRLLLSYAELVLEQISLLYSDSAQLCNRYFGMELSGAALDSAKYFSEEMLAKESSLMAEVLRSSAIGDYRPPAAGAIAARWNMIMALIGKRYGANAGLFFDARQAKRDPGKTCHVLYEFYKAVIQLPSREAGPLLRHHYAQLQARSLPAAPAAAKPVSSLPPAASHRRSTH